ncbi:MAG: hypothetical protein D6160_10990 [Ketobacter sp.]|nr:MAG: hypothetical protein D6160_10990 [Ketobacter sp.]
MKKSKLITGFIVGAFVAQAGFAQNLGKELVLGEGEVRMLPSGAYEFTTIVLGKNSTLETDGSLTLVSEKFSSVDGASIEYTGAQTQINAVKNFNIQTLDASGVQFLYIKADGADAPDKERQAAQGGNGRDARKVGHSWSEPKGRSSSRGGAGAIGSSAQNGEHAANISLHLPLIKPGSTLRLHANGGDGGKGQQGGAGGQGGDGAAGHPPSSGGDGGQGGNGGNGGNAGKVFVYLVVNDEMPDDSQEDLLKSLRLDVGASGGALGSGGEGGARGQGGSNGGSGHGRGSRGSIGPSGGDGQPGVDSSVNPKDRWVVVDVLPASRYAAVYTQTLSKIRAKLLARP